MRDGRSSGTAAYVAFLRALGHRGMTSAAGFVDPIARELLPPPWGLAVELAPILAKLPRRTRHRIIAHVDMLVCRSLAIDRELTRALDRGCTQVVILGAGYDDRGHRMTELERAHVFEVDHPATQSVKLRHAAGLPRTCRELTYVPCNFGIDVLTERLASAGHRTDEPTAWIWEGVTLYLTDAAIHETLATIAARCAAQSTLVIEYHDSKAPTSWTLYAWARRFLLALWSEPQIGRRPPQVMHRKLERAALRVEKDFGISEWGVTFAQAMPPEREASARLAIATRIAH